MHPRIDELLQHLELQREVLRSAMESVPVGKRSEHPAPDSWSVANVLEHLAILEQRVAGILADRVEEARAAGLGRDAETASVMSTVDAKRIVDRTQRIVTPERGQPTGQLDAAAAFAKLKETRQQLIDLAIAADGLALQDVTQVHPILGTLNFYQWLATIGWHEARHAAQIIEIRDRLVGAAPGTQEAT